MLNRVAVHVAARIAADRAYRNQRIRHWLRQHRIIAVISPKKRPGPLARFEKLAVNYLMLVKLALIERYLRLL